MSAALRECCPLAALELSTSHTQAERRRHFDQAAIAELAAGLKTVGMLQPIVVRPVPLKGGYTLDADPIYQIVAGERRFLAAKIAELDEVPISVRELSDEQVLEIQLLENLQRADLHPLCEAESYETLQKKHGHSVDDLVAKFGKNRAHVYARLKLTELCPEARKAFYANDISASIALLIARIPLEELQREALEAITSGRALMGGERREISTREAEQLVHDKYMLSLAGAPFPTGADLLPGVPMCGQCPKNTNAQPELFGEVKRGKNGAGTCTDPVCFGKKRDAFAQRKLEQARGAGQKVIEGKAAKAATRYGTTQLQSGLVNLDQRCYDDPKQRTYAQLLGKDFEPTLLAVPAAAADAGPNAPAVIEVATREQINEALKDKLQRPTARPGSPQSSAEKKAKLERRVLEAVYMKLRPRLPEKLGRDELEAIAFAFYCAIWNELRKRVLALWGWESRAEGKKNWHDPNAPVRAHLHACTDAQLALFLQDCLHAGELHVGTYDEGKPTVLLAAAKRAKLDIAAIRRTIEGDAKARAAKKPRAKK